MSITRLYYPHPVTPGETISLDKNASHHLIRVTRTRKGADVILFNGDGYEYTATLLDENRKSCTLSVNAATQPQRESPTRITLLQGISRSERMDISIQKSTELGVASIIPVLCEHSAGKFNSDRADKKITHWKQIVISACEQSGRCVIPELKSITTLTDALQQKNDACKLVLDPDSKNSLRNTQAPDGGITILIGPESGLSQDEIKLAHDHGFTGIKLGPRILRTETAGPACIAAIQTLWGDLGS